MLTESTITDEQFEQLARLIEVGPVADTGSELLEQLVKNELAVRIVFKQAFGSIAATQLGLRVYCAKLDCASLEEAFDKHNPESAGWRGHPYEYVH